MGDEGEEEEDDAKDAEDEVWGVTFEKGGFVSYIFLGWFLFFFSSLCIGVGMRWWYEILTRR